MTQQETLDAIEAGLMDFNIGLDMAHGYLGQIGALVTTLREQVAGGETVTQAQLDAVLVLVGGCQERLAHLHEHSDAILHPPPPAPEE